MSLPTVATRKAISAFEKAERANWRAQIADVQSDRMAERIPQREMALYVRKTSALREELEEHYLKRVPKARRIHLEVAAP